MRLILHTGAHYTEQERLMKSILRNKEMLRTRGMAVPGPGRYRTLMRDTLNALHRQAPSENAREILLDAILDEEPAERVLLSDPNFFRTPGTAVQAGRLYPAAASRMAHMAALFPEDEIEIFIAMRNPAALLPIFHGVSLDPSEGAFWGGRAPQEIRWSDTLHDIRAAVPDVPITVWCNEDMPLLWATIIRAICGLPEGEKIVGGFDLLSSIMSREGMQRFRAYIDSHPNMSEIQKRKVIAAFLDKFALEEEIEEELDMAGWTEELVEELTALYDEDMDLVAQLPGITFLSP